MMPPSVGSTTAQILGIVCIVLIATAARGTGKSRHLLLCTIENDSMSMMIVGIRLPRCYYLRTIHKMHHRYHQPTAFSAAAMHPVEMLFHQVYLTSVPFLFPIHIGVYIPTLLYVYYYGMCDHSGIKMDALWPWQPSTKYHDNHHKLFHVNFGLNTCMMDWLHGTMARPDRTYGETVFGGYGKLKK
ncbi:hypothetical protein FSP39_002201 [Pinctada imbricata]|uniref:Fatty acid hydroxylase domain-containing protein n=1 Tax=Pinctada imbricata TaxID=66713 RepID=A0AA88YHE8_PINIB|nr:hypothetical protein FSP39_002201 [Pinctada imbricata]